MPCSANAASPYQAPANAGPPPAADSFQQFMADLGELAQSYSSTVATPTTAGYGTGGQFASAPPPITINIGFNPGANGRPAVQMFESWGGMMNMTPAPMNSGYTQSYQTPSYYNSGGYSGGGYGGSTPTYSSYTPSYNSYTPSYSSYNAPIAYAPMTNTMGPMDMGRMDMSGMGDMDMGGMDGMRMGPPDLFFDMSQMSPTHGLREHTIMNGFDRIYPPGTTSAAMSGEGADITGMTFLVRQAYRDALDEDENLSGVALENKMAQILTGYNDMDDLDDQSRAELEQFVFQAYGLDINEMSEADRERTIEHLFHSPVPVNMNVAASGPIENLGEDSIDLGNLHNLNINDEYSTVTQNPDGSWTGNLLADNNDPTNAHYRHNIASVTFTTNLTDPAAVKEAFLRAVTGEDNNDTYPLAASARNYAMQSIPGAAARLA